MKIVVDLTDETGLIALDYDPSREGEDLEPSWADEYASLLKLASRTVRRANRARRWVRFRRRSG